MSQNYINFQAVEEATAIELQHGITLQDNMIKLVEEVGEVAQALLAYQHSVTRSRSAGDVTNVDLAEECLDVINNAMNIINRLNVPDDVLLDIFNRKCEKWKNKFS